MEKTIYDLKLGEELEIGAPGSDIYMRRVPGGWVMENYVLSSSCFVPLNYEFQNKPEKL